VYQGTGDGLLHYVDGGVYAMEHLYLHEFMRTGPLLEAIRAYTADLPPALCGLSRYRSASFGKEFENSFFATQYLLHKIVQYPLIRKGSTFQAEERDFLTSDNHDVHITDVLEDADGSLLFVDMGGWFTYGFLGSPLPKPEILGAIYRIRRVRTPAVSDLCDQRLQLATP